jgi:lactoylglutathione lyase
MPSTTLRTGHVGVNVTDLARSTDFYVAAFGLDVLGRSVADGARFAFLGIDGQLVLTLWEQAAERFSPSTAGLHHLSFQADEVADVHAIEARLRAAGAAMVHDGIVAHREGASSGGIYFLDPDGTRLEVFVADGVDAHAPSGEAPTCGFF